MILLYLAAGVNHFIYPYPYQKIIPPWIPHPDTLVIISGICEILFALLLIPVKTRPLAAWSVIVLLIVVFPANVQMMVNFYRKSSPWLWLTVLRLPLQILLIYWAYSFTEK
jgi:uncharacterized membrane protein